MPTYTFLGVDIKFPYVAYDVQIASMRKAIAALHGMRGLPRAAREPARQWQDALTPLRDAGLAADARV